MKALRFLRALPLALLLIAPAHADQGTIVGPVVGPKTMAEVMTTINGALLAIQSCNSGTSAPANGPSAAPKAFQCWADTSAAPVITYKTYDGTSWVAFGQLNTSTHVWTPYRNGALIAAVATSSSAADLTTGTLPAARLPVPTASTLGGVQSKTCSASQWLNEITTSGVPNCAQPNFTDLAGTAALAQLPAFSGMSAAAAAADADTFPTNQGAGNLKQTLAAIKTWIKAWIVKADVGLGNVDNTSDVTKWAATKTLTNTTYNCGSTGNVCTVRLASDITGFGTGVASALGVNIGSAGAPLVFNGAGGTPSSMVGTNITGTAAGLTAGNVTTNANLTGDVTSVGNATTLPTVNSNVGSFGGVAAVPNLTVNAKGQVTAAGSQAYQDGTNAAKGVVRGDGSTITCVAGVCTSVGSAATSVAVGTTTITGGASGTLLTNNNGVLGNAALRSYLAGLALSTAGSSASFGIATGVATDSTNVSMMSLGSAYTKLNTSWAVGSGNGSVDTGSIGSNTWYHVFQIQRPDTGVVDILTSLSATAPTLPTNYTLFRRIGSLRTDGSGNWLLFSQFGDEFLWGVGSLVNDVNDNTLGTTPKLYTLRVPSGVKVISRIRTNGTTSSFLISSPDEGAAAFNTPTSNQTSNSASGVTTNTLDVRTNTSAQIQAGAAGASTAIFITAYGWIDRRGRDN